MATGTATTTNTLPRLKSRYNNTIKAQLAKDLGIENEMQIPKLDKIVINMGVGRATQQPSLLEKAPSRTSPSSPVRSRS
jgi:large subunit ribosomal protein L5